MKYKELPKEKLIQKLLSISFDTPAKNRDVYMWCNKVLTHVQFVENERIKLVKKYGEKIDPFNIKVPQDKMDDWINDMNNILEMDIPEEIQPCPIKSEWLDEDKCCYPEDKSMWITPKEIGALFQKA